MVAITSCFWGVLSVDGFALSQECSGGFPVERTRELPRAAMFGDSQAEQEKN